MPIQHVIHHTYQVTLTDNKKLCLRLSSKKKAKELAAAIASEDVDIKVIPIRRSDFTCVDNTNNYGIMVDDKYILHYKIIVDKITLDVAD